MNFAAVNAALPTLDVLRWLGLEEWGHDATMWRGRCPFHHSTSSKSRSLAVSLEKRKFYCHRCKKGGDLIDLASKVLCVTLFNAGRQLEEEFLS